MKNMLVALVAAGFVGLFVLSAQSVLAESVPVQIQETEQGKVLIGAGGEPLFVYGEDTATQSKCTGECLADWEPLLAAKDSTPDGDFTVIQRETGEMQWAHRGRPLYEGGGLDPNGMLPHGWSVAKP